MPPKPPPETVGVFFSTSFLFMYAYLLQVGADLLGGFRSDLLQVLGLVAVEDRHGWRGRRGSVRQLRGGSPPAFDQVAADGSPGSARLARSVWICSAASKIETNGDKKAGVLSVGILVISYYNCPFVNIISIVYY